MRQLLQLLLPALAALGLSVALAAPALACGGLVAPDGAVRLERATTLIAYHNGVEHYMTSFEYQGDEKNLGWIVPLPAIPDAIQEGGAWSLQRLEREANPPPPEPIFAAGVAATNAPVTIIQQTTIEALDITVIKGSGPAIIDWATGNGFAVNADERAHLLIYAHASPIFMAAKFDTSKIQQRHETQGDGTPLLITMRLAHPWVPLEVLALDGQQVQADLFFLTDMPLNTSDFAATVGQSPVGSSVPGAPGFTVAFQEPMNASLYHDLSTDRNMGWVHDGGWLTYLTLNAPAAQVTYDLGVTSRGVIRLAPFGTAPMAIGGANAAPTWLPQLPIGTPTFVFITLLVAGLVAFIIFMNRRRKPIPSVSAEQAKWMD
jgi:hypothetical protein